MPPLMGDLGRYKKLKDMSIEMNMTLKMKDDIDSAAITRPRLRLGGFARAIAQTKSLETFSMTISDQAVNPDVTKIIGVLKGNRGLRSVNIAIE
jgi:hypothetical protein